MSCLGRSRDLWGKQKLVVGARLRGGRSTDATSHAAGSAGWTEVMCDFGVGAEGVGLHEGKSISFQSMHLDGRGEDMP